ncbi:MAG TPA: ATP-binding cassette domain-containing protein [Firmicutes bacterium]|nr:ATP-binding cassette domain-containing protein [Bacillota bacterium]
MIEVENLTKQYGDLVAVDDISFEIDRGEILGFLGPNAAGKTTTLRMLTCYIPPTRGTARVGGYDIFLDSLDVRKRLGYLPEHVPLYYDMRVLDYLNFVGAVKGLDPRDKTKVIKRAMGQCGLDKVKDKIIATLSKGYRQRVGLAQALLGDPEVLMLDEPTTGLDPRQITEIRELIKELGEGHTVLLSTHILPEVSMICDRIIIINKGKLVAADSVENLTKALTKTQMTQVNVKGDPAKIVASIKKTTGVLAVDKKPEMDLAGGGHVYIVHSRIDYDVREEIARVIVMDGHGLHEMRPYSLSLEDIFLILTDDKKGKRN